MLPFRWVFNPLAGEEETSFPSPFPGRPGLSQSPQSAGFSDRRTSTVLSRNGVERAVWFRNEKVILYSTYSPRKVVNNLGTIDSLGY